MLITPAAPGRESQIFPLGAGATTIGRDASCDLVLDNGSISRRHAAIRGRGGAYILDDLESRNGTTVNGIAVVRRRLCHGDHLSFGDVPFVFEEGEPPRDAELITPPTSLQHGRRDTVALPPRPTAGAAATAGAVHAWRIVRRAAATPPDERKQWLEETAADLGGLAGVRHVLVFLPRGAVAAGETFIRNGRAGSPFSEELLRATAARGTPAGRSAGRPADVTAGAPALDAACIPIDAGPFGRGCLYVEGADTLPVEAVSIALFAAEALGVGLLAAARREGDAVAPPRDEEDAETGIVGRSGPFLETIRIARKAARSDLPVLIRGETGTGKELIARLIYQEGARRGAPYRPFHCSAVGEHLLGSALFGHEKGAFTGAVTARKGLFEEADGGTIFLDEVGELTPAMQVQLLRALQEGEICRLGSNAVRKVDVRVIAATNRDLESAIRQGAFREDLYFRLKGVELRLPPLRERAEDIPDLARHFVEKHRRDSRSVAETIADDAMKALQDYRWPGNIRELANVIGRAMVLAEDRVLRREDLALDPPVRQTARAAGGEPRRSDEELTLEAVKDRHILLVYERCGRNQAEAARRLGISRSTLIERLKTLLANPPND